MDIDLKELDNDFLSKNSKLITLYKKQNTLGIIGFIIAVISILAFALNFIFTGNVLLGILILIIPLLLFVFIDKVIGFPNFNVEFDNQKGKYLQKLLGSIANSSLKFISSTDDLIEMDIAELGFLKQKTDPALKFVRKNYITGTYRNLNVKICELDVSTKISRVKRTFLTWQPSTLIVLDNIIGNQKERTSIYCRESLHYSKHKTEEDGGSMLPIIEQLSEYIKLDGTEIKTGINTIDEKYLILNTKEEIELMERGFIDRLTKFDQISHYANGKIELYNVKFLTLHKDKIVITIFNQPFLKQRMDSIFEAYNDEIKSILCHIDIFVEPNQTDK